MQHGVGKNISMKKVMYTNNVKRKKNLGGKNPVGKSAASCNSPGRILLSLGAVEVSHNIP
jgi:hypothetical protein